MIDFIIIGAQKAGTTAAAYNLNLHPDLSVFSGVTEYGQREIEFFNQHWERGADWYLSHLDPVKKLRGEKTAELLHRTICHPRIYSVNPNVKLIVLLRSPIERSFSQWKMAVCNKKDEVRSFSEVILDEISKIDMEEYKSHFYSCRERKVSNWREGYVLKSFYYEQLVSLFRFFRRENVYIAISEKIKANMKSEYNKIFRFLEVDDFIDVFEEKFVCSNNLTMHQRDYNNLKDLFKKQNEKLFGLLGYEIKEWL